MIKDEPNKRSIIVKKKSGPTTDADFDTFAKLCGIQCAAREIAVVMGCSVDTLRIRVREKYGTSLAAALEHFRDEGLVSIRRAQFSKALSGNTSMLIWLGKQLLDQSEKPGKIKGDDDSSKVANMANHEVLHGLEKRIERIQRRRKTKGIAESTAERPASSKE